MPEFLRLHKARSPHIMWLLGAGASASAGIPTAGQMIWGFKRTIYCTALRKSVRSCPDLSDPVLRARLQEYLDGLGRFPPADADIEYEEYFEATYREEADRRRHIEDLVRGAHPSYGHIGLAALLAAGGIRLLWTTNFDRLVEDAAAEVMGSSSALTVAQLDEPTRAMEAMNEERWPLLVKLHGDYQSRRLKNTARELQSQDSQMRASLVEASRRSGLAVVGYSGRDRSVMDALAEATSTDGCFPFGLYWMHLPSSPLRPQVGELLTSAAEHGAEAAVVAVQTFDELFGDLLHLETDLPEGAGAALARRPSRISYAPEPPRTGGWPVVRMNALQVVAAPTTCRLVVCKIGGTRDVREAVERTGAEVIAARRQAGVIAFGTDQEIRRAFAGDWISELDIHPIEPARLRYDSAELGLLYAALSRALSRARPLRSERKGNTYFAVAPPEANTHPLFRGLREVVGGALHGSIRNSPSTWSEAVRLRLEYRQEKLWLLYEPMVFLDRGAGEERDQAAADFVRERQARRYNQTWNGLLAAWADIITNGEADARIRASDGEGAGSADFTISKLTAFSRRDPQE